MARCPYLNSVPAALSLPGLLSLLLVVVGVLVTEVDTSHHHHRHLNFDEASLYGFDDFQPEPRFHKASRPARLSSHRTDLRNGLSFSISSPRAHLFSNNRQGNPDISDPKDNNNNNNNSNNSRAGIHVNGHMHDMYPHHHPGLNISWPVKRVAYKKGEVMLGALMMVHERHANWTCGPIMPQGGIQALECMLFTIDYVNRQEWMPSNVSFGYYILDDCDSDTYGLEQAVDFIKGSIGRLHDNNDQITCSQKSSGGESSSSSGNYGSATVDVISGVLGAASSVTSIQVANLLRLFRIPQISFFSTSPELSNKQRFEYFLRTVPSDRDQAAAMVELVKLLKWTYISIVYEESNYGIQAFSVLESLLGQQGICIAAKEKLTKDSGQANDKTYDHIVDKLKAKSRARGVIVFGSDQEVAHLMSAVARGNATGMFSWIGSDGWSARSLVSDGHEAQVEGTISVQPMAHPIPEFESYFRNLTAQGNKRNPWFIEYWEYTFKCRWPNGTATPYNQAYNRTCSGHEKLSDNSQTGGFELERQLQFVSDAVLAFAYAVKEMHEGLCKGYSGLCRAMRPIEGSQLLSYLKRVTFNGLTSDEFRFAESTLDGPSRYNILHFKQTKPGTYDWVKIGEYRDGQLTLNQSEIQFRLEERNTSAEDGSILTGTIPSAPISVCSLPCERGSAKKFLEGEKCCWQCMPCQKYEVLRTETECVECAKGTLPDADHQVCLEIPAQHVNPHSSWATGAMAFASAGAILTLCVIYVFIRYRDTPVVRASGRELSAVLLLGILFCYCVTFVLVQKPTDLFCGLQRTGVGLSFTVVYAAILTKSNRIARIFRAGKRTSRRPSFISPKSQLIICGILVCIQVLITAVWLLFSPPKAVKHYPTREQSQLLCQASLGSSYVVSFAYPVLLVCVCTAYALITRKIPEAFNESKYIGFTMYTTCIIWLSFIPLYLTTSSQLAIGVTVMCVSISLSATVTLVCMFAPKLYIILLHPEKNVRQPVGMLQNNRYGALKSIQRRHVECATQSDDLELGVTIMAKSAVSLASSCAATQTEEEAEEPEETDRLWRQNGIGGDVQL